jgi:hypothetical protein
VGRPRPLYIAFQKVPLLRKNSKPPTHYSELNDEPGAGHALDAVSTRDGDPWGSTVGRHLAALARPHFYTGEGPKAACGARVRVVLPTEIDAEDPQICQECADLMRTGAAVGRWGSGRRYSPCGSFVRWETDRGVSHYQCKHREFHDGPHKDPSGATWEEGESDFTPPPDGYV